ncbi:MAG: hypothetical protein KF836_11615 [Fimbriimonadaceae bacterium]|nr:hypothetical protein [Fimbriimonadaceae bacterium]
MVRKVGIAIAVVVGILAVVAIGTGQVQAALNKTQMCEAALAEYSTYDIGPRTSTENLNKIISSVQSAQVNCSQGDIVLWMTKTKMKPVESSKEDQLEFFNWFYYDIPEENPSWVKVIEENGKIVLTAQDEREGAFGDPRDLFVLFSTYPLRHFPD